MGIVPLCIQYTLHVRRAALQWYLFTDAIHAFAAIPSIIINVFDFLFLEIS